MSFDSFINTIVPWCVGIFMAWILYKPLAKPLGELYHWIKGLITGVKDRFSNDDEDGKFNFTGEREIAYE